MPTPLLAGGTDIFFFYEYFFLLFNHLLLTAVGNRTLDQQGPLA